MNVIEKVYEAEAARILKIVPPMLQALAESGRLPGPDPLGRYDIARLAIAALQLGNLQQEAIAAAEEILAGTVSGVAPHQMERARLIVEAGEQPYGFHQVNYVEGAKRLGSSVNRPKAEKLTTVRNPEKRPAGGGSAFPQTSPWLA